MKLLKQRSILKTLFIPYTILFIIIFNFLMFYFVMNESTKIKTNALTTLNSNIKNINNNLDVEINSLDTLSQNIIYSNLIKDHFIKYINYNSESLSNLSEHQKIDNIQNTKILYDLLVTMMGPNHPIDQIYLYDLHNLELGVGLDNSSSYISVNNKAWYDDVLSSKGNKVIYFNKDDRLGRYSPYEEGQYFLSLYRVYYNTLNVPQGIIEVKKSFKNIFTIIKDFNNAYGSNVYIYYKNGQPIYPINQSSSTTNYYNLISTNIDKNISNNLFKYKNEYVLFDTSSYSDFTIVATIDNSKLMSPIYEYIKTNVVLSLLITFATATLSYFIAKIITTPLNKIYNQVKGFQITDDASTNFKEIDTHITELNTLFKAFLKMQQKAKIAMTNELILQNREMQSKMLALQSQMNPHFLYNALSTIQAMADEQMNEEIIIMCQSISRILRYISSDSQQLVSLTDEIAHTIDYLQCMQIRYDNDLTYTLNIPDEMQNIKIPKLCLQLIVENAVKFTTKTELPWHIDITGYVTDTHWEMQIKDSGSGFAEDNLKQLQEKIDSINANGVLPNLELNGMGLMNIYIRFKILYNGKQIFRLINNTPNGATVIMGGIKL